MNGVLSDKKITLAKKSDFVLFCVCACFVAVVKKKKKKKKKKEDTISLSKNAKNFR